MSAEGNSTRNQPYQASDSLLESEAGREPASGFVEDPEVTATLISRGIVRRARLASFPDLGNMELFPAQQGTSGSHDWVVDSQIAEGAFDFGLEEQERLFPQRAPAPKSEPERPRSSEVVVSSSMSTPASAPAPSAPVTPPPALERVENAELPAPETHLVPVSKPEPPASMQTVAELPDSAFRKLSALEAEYIGFMRNWLKEEGSKPGSALSQASPAEQVQLALEVLNNELSRKFQSRVPPSFTSLAQAYLFGWGPLDHLMNLEGVTEVMVNGMISIYIERAGRLEPVGPGLDDETIYTIAERMTGQRPTLAEPMLDDRLKDGSRLNATHASVSLLGATLSIRRFPRVALTAEDLLRTGSVSRELLHFLDTIVRGRLNIVISGGTNTGKTTLLNVLLGSIPATERLVIIEQAPAEIRCNLPNRAHLLTRPRTADGAAEVSVTALVRNALRMRPDRIVVGESRGGEALAMLQAMNTGHAGSLTTLHANNAFDALARLETMVLMAESGLPHEAIRSQIARAIQIIIQTRRDANGRRYVSEVVQVIPSPDSASGYACSVLFEGRQEHGAPVCRRTRASIDQSLIDQMLSYGVRLDESSFSASGLAR